MEFWGKQFTALAVYYFCKKLDFKCLTGLYLRLCLYWWTNINICFLWDAFERHLNHIISLFKQDSQLISTIRLSRSGFLIANKFLKIFYCFQFSPGTRVYSNLCLLSSEALKIIRPLCWEVIHKKQNIHRFDTTTWFKEFKFFANHFAQNKYLQECNEYH